MKEGTCQRIKDLPAEIKEIFVVSADITAEEHVRMQAALQAFVDNSLSKTINFPENATEDDVATAYIRAWELNCKGLTVYVTGSRDEVVLETHSTAKKKAPAAEDAMPDQIKLWQETKKPRPRALIGRTFSIEPARQGDSITDQRERYPPALRGVHQHRQSRLRHRRGQRSHRAAHLLRAAPRLSH